MLPIRWSRGALAAALISLVTIVAGCSGDESLAVSVDHDPDSTVMGSAPAPARGSAPVGSRSFVEAAEATETYVSVSVESDGSVVGHVCEGEEMVERLDGVVRGDGVVEASGPLGTFVWAEVDGDEMSGIATLSDGSDHPFQASTVDGDAGDLGCAPDPDALLVP